MHTYTRTYMKRQMHHAYLTTHTHIRIIIAHMIRSTHLTDCFSPGLCWFRLAYLEWIWNTHYSQRPGACLKTKAIFRCIPGRRTQPDPIRWSRSDSCKWEEKIIPIDLAAFVTVEVICRQLNCFNLTDAELICHRSVRGTSPPSVCLSQQFLNVFISSIAETIRDDAVHSCLSKAELGEEGDDKMTRD